MPDRLTPEQRSRLMARIRGKDTGIELAVRRAVHARGLRFRKHARGIPGTPDLVFPRPKVAVRFRAADRRLAANRVGNQIGRGLALGADGETRGSG